jgi:hypothetical protein
MNSHHNIRIRSRAAAGTTVTAVVSCAALAFGAADASASSSSAAGVTVPAGFHASLFASAPKGVTGADDITELGDHVFVAFQNGVGTMGEPSPTGNTKSTVVEYNRQGKVVNTWSVVGKVDGMGADPSRDQVIATVNEDGNSSLYTISPDRHGHSASDEVKHYSYAQNPLPHGGGTDSVVVRNGVIFISASNPSADANGTTFSGPALYKADLDGNTAKLTAVLHGDSTATDAVTGKKVTLNLSDPDSSELVPRGETRFGGDLLLDSQADGELIFLHNPGHANQQATVLNLTTQVDDTAFAAGSCGSTLYVVDNGTNEILAITGNFGRGIVFTAVPNDSTVDPGNLATVNMATGAVTPFGSGFVNPHGLLFVSNDEH